MHTRAKTIELTMRRFIIHAMVTAALQCLTLTCVNASAFAASNSLSGTDFTGVTDPSSNVSIPGPSYPLIQNSYFTDDHGNILMIVNVLGEVGRVGQVVVQEDADFATIFTLAGGLKEKANLKKVLVARKEPDKNGAQAYLVDISQFFTRGDRSSFIIIKPNDTIIVPQKGWSLEKIASIFGYAMSGISGVYYIKNL